MITVQGNITNPDGSPATGEITFKLLPLTANETLVTQGGTTRAPLVDGFFSVELTPNTKGFARSKYACVFPNLESVEFVLGAGLNPVDLKVLLMDRTEFNTVELQTLSEAVVSQLQAEGDATLTATETIQIGDPVSSAGAVSTGLDLVGIATSSAESGQTFKVATAGPVTISNHPWPIGSTLKTKWFKYGIVTDSNTVVVYIDRLHVIDGAISVSTNSVTVPDVQYSYGFIPGATYTIDTTQDREFALHVDESGVHQLTEIDPTKVFLGWHWGEETVRGVDVLGSGISLIQYGNVRHKRTTYTSTAQALAALMKEPALEHETSRYVVYENTRLGTSGTWTPALTPSPNSFTSYYYISLGECYVRFVANYDEPQGELDLDEQSLPVYPQGGQAIFTSQWDGNQVIAESTYVY